MQNQKHSQVMKGSVTARFEVLCYASMTFHTYILPFNHPKEKAVFINMYMYLCVYVYLILVSLEKSI